MGRDKQSVDQRTGDPVTDLGLDTITNDKQAIVFVNTKRSAEACSERIADAVEKHLPIAKRHRLSNAVTNVLSSPTSQCERLGKAVRSQAAFHHSGLHSEQRSIVERAFKNGKIQVICATPTLAAGLDMPAYRVVIRDLKRYSGGWGMQPIPVLEYDQMSGRAGRPSYDDEGQAITIAESDQERDEITEKYVNADPEPIQSKLAARPVLRSHTLSLVATGFVSDEDDLVDFMDETFYAHQYGDDERLHTQLMQVKENLMAWEMIERDGEQAGNPDSVEFVSAKEYSQTMDLNATSLGHRVSELYLDPYTANNLVERLQRADESTTPFAFLHMICHTLEMRPLIRVKKGDKQPVEAALLEREDELLIDAPDRFDDDYKSFLNGVKTTLVLYDWINEVSEKELNDKWDVTPGHLQAKRSLADWLLYSCDEILDVISSEQITEEIRRLRQRVNLGVREALLGLTRFDGVGRVRSRRLYNAGIENAGDVKATSFETLQDILGPKTAKDLKNQVGQEVTTETVKRETHGNLLDYRDD